MIKKFNQGFTLIELLVVIAIIGILSSVVLASLNTARGKGADAAIKSNLANIRAQAELFYDNVPGNYTGLCADPVVAGQLNSARGAAGVTAATDNTLASAGTATLAVCHVSATGDKWAAEVPLKATPANSWCVDSSGASKQITGGYLATTVVVCP